MPITTTRALRGLNDGSLHMGSEAYGNIFLSGVFNWMGPTVAPQIHVTQSSNAYAFARMDPTVTPPSTKSTVQASVSVSPYAEPVVMTSTDTVVQIYADTTFIPAFFGDSYTISGSGSGYSRAQWRDASVAEQVSSISGQMIQIELIVREYYEKTTLAIYHGPPVLSRLIQCSTYTVVSGAVTLSDETEGSGEDVVTFKRIANNTGSPVVFEVKVASFSAASSAEQALWVCGFAPAIRARANGGSFAVDLEVFRNSTGSLSGTALTTASFDTAWQWQVLGGPREVMGHDQTSASTWKITELGDGYMTITGLLTAGGSLDIRAVGCRFYMVPMPSESVTGDY